MLPRHGRAGYRRDRRRPRSRPGSRRNAGAVEPPLAFERIAGGRSNLTYEVSDAAGRRWALRRPPLGKRLASAHDMGREHRIISALQGTDVPVAPAVGLCEDDRSTTPVLRHGLGRGPDPALAAEAEAFPDQDDRRAIGERVVDTLVAIHAVDPDAAGLGELAKKEDYVARQLRRWHGQWEKQHTRELPLIDEVHDRLAARIPEQGPATIVHGDYRLDNMILSPGGEVAAVVDWELCTLGDPLADVGLLLVYWGEQGDELSRCSSRRRWRRASRPARRSARYAERSGRDLSEIDFYVALGLWKLAIVLEGVFARYAAGQYGAAPTRAKQFARIVERLVEPPTRPSAGWTEPHRRRGRDRRRSPAGRGRGPPRPVVELAAGDHHLVDLVGTVGDLEHAREAPHPRQRGVVGHPERRRGPGSRGRARP